MKSKVILLALAVSLIAIFPMALNVSADFPGDRGPIMDVLRHRVILSPDAALVAMLEGSADISPDQIRTSDIETQVGAGMLATQDLGFHMGFIAYNIRDTATINYIRANYPYWFTGEAPQVSYWPLQDAEFRHALIHSYDQLGIIPPIYGYIVTPVRSLVPPAQSKYYNAAIPEHEFNQGDPFTTPAGDHSTVGILKAAGYTFVDADDSKTVTDVDYWEMPNGDPVPQMVIWTPLEEVAPTSFEHGQEFAADLGAIGLQATSANGYSGLLSEGATFGEYLDKVYGTEDTPGGRFDAYMVFWGMGRMPDQLFFALHTSQDSYLAGPPWGQSNGPGVNDPTIDDLVETVRFSLDTDEIEVAAEEVQAMLYTPDETIYPNADNFALSYMLLYSRAYTNVFTNDLRGAVKSPGYGSDNGWTFLNLKWAGESGPIVNRQEDVDGDGDLETVMIYINGLPPDSLNPTIAITAYEWNTISPNLDGLIDVNPYNHADIPWIATDWAVTETPEGGMRIDFTLRTDVHWADGYPVNASDVEFGLEFFRDWNTPNFFDQSQKLIDVVVTGEFTGYILASEAGLPLFYDYMGSALVLPRQIWDRDWGTTTAVVDYPVWTIPYGTDMAPGYDPGPWADKVAKNLFGTGPWIFRFWDPLGFYDEEWANRNYFMTKTEIADLLTSMFHEVGDVDYDADVDSTDVGKISISFGYFSFEEKYDPDADLDVNGLVDTFDYATASFYLGWQKEYP